MPSHTSALPPKALWRRIAISGEIPLLPLTRLLSACRVTPSAWAPLVTLKLRGSRQSCRTDNPGWGGFFMRITRAPSVIVHQIDISRIAVFETKDDAPIAVDRYAPTSGERTLQRMQPPAGQVHVSRLAGTTQTRQHAP